MIYLDFLLIIVQSALWRIGGASKQEIKFAAAWYRDILIPVINFFYFWVTMNFLTGFLTAGAANIIRMGYGAYDPEHDDKPSLLAKWTKDREGWRIRMIYGFITSVFIGLFPMAYALFVKNHLWAFPGFLLYVLINIGSEYLLNTTKIKGNVWVVEPLTGASRALVFLLCK